MAIEISIFALILLLIGFFAGLHVGVVLGGAAVLMMAIFSDRPATSLFANATYNVLSEPTFIVLPLYALMGELLVQGQLTTSLYSALGKWVTRLRGGLLHTNILATSVFGTVAGTSIGTATTIGAVAIPEMNRRGYPASLSMGSLGAGGTLGLMLPPSVILVIYGVIAQTSIADLFLAGIVPGIILTVLFMITIVLVVRMFRIDLPREPRSTMRDKLGSSVHLIPTFVLLLIVVGSIMLGIATPLESAAFGAVGALIIAFLYRKLTWARFKAALLAASLTTGSVIVLLIGSAYLRLALGYLGVTREAGQLLVNSGVNATVFIAVVCVVFLILGAFIDDLAIFVTIVPILIPMVEQLGIDKVWFGILMTMLVQCGMIIPPYGMNLFVLHTIQRRFNPKAHLGDAFRGAVPFIIALFLMIGLIIAVPDLVTWLPYAID